MTATTELIEYDTDDVRARIMVRTSNTLIGTRRTMLREDARVLTIQASKAGQPMEPAVMILRNYTFPDCVSPSDGTIEIKGDAPIDADHPDLPPARVVVISYQVRELPFDRFLDLPEELVIKWEHAAYKVNPHWQPTAPDEVKKEATTSTDALPA